MCPIGIVSLGRKQLATEIFKTSEAESLTSQEAVLYFGNLLRDIRAMLNYARDQGFVIDYELRSEITRLLTGRSASEPLFVPDHVPAGELPTSPSAWDESGSGRLRT
jgi:hypothetical protein